MYADANHEYMTCCRRLGSSHKMDDNRKNILNRIQRLCVQFPTSQLEQIETSLRRQLAETIEALSAEFARLILESSNGVGDMSFRDAEHWRNKDQEKAE